MRCPFCPRFAAWRGECLVCDCGAVVRGRESDPLHYDLPAEGAPIPDSPWRDAADARLDAERAATTARIGRLDALRAEVVALAREDASDRLAPPLRYAVPAAARAGWREIVRMLALDLWSLARRLGGDADAVLRPQPTRAQPFAGRRHAVAVALGHEGAAPIGLGSCLPSPGPGTPPPEGDRGIRGELRALSAIDAQRAVQRARVDIVIDARGRITSPGRPIPAPWLRLLVLVDWGKERKRATVRKRGVDLAVEPLDIRDAFEAVRQEHKGDPDCPATLHEARLALRRTRHAIDLALLDRQLVPPPRPRRHRPEPLAPTLATEAA